MLAKERRERARRIEERARLTRIEQLKWMSEQEEKSNERAVQKQLKTLADLDAQLAERIEEDEEWLQARLEAERLEELEAMHGECVFACGRLFGWPLAAGHSHRQD